MQTWGVLPLVCKGAMYVSIGYFVSARVGRNLIALPKNLWPKLFLPMLLALMILTPFVSYNSAAGGLVLAFFGGGGVIGLSKWLEASGHAAFLRFVGTRSLQIYLAHTVATAGLRMFLLFWTPLHSFVPVLIIAWAGGLAFPLGLDWAARRLGATWIFSLRHDKLSGRPKTKATGLLSPDPRRVKTGLVAKEPDSKFVRQLGQDSEIFAMPE
jgi:hypothetical protein